MANIGMADDIAARDTTEQSFGRTRAERWVVTRTIAADPKHRVRSAQETAARPWLAWQDWQWYGSSLSWSSLFGKGSGIFGG